MRFSVLKNPITFNRVNTWFNNMIKYQYDISNYLAIETAGGVDWHPNETKLVFSYNAPGLFQIFETKVKEGITGNAIQLSSSENRSTDPCFLSDGTIVFHRDFGGNENFQLFVLTNSNKEQKITSDYNAKHVVLFVSEKYLYYRANVTNKSKFEIFRQKIPVLYNQPERIFSPDKGLPVSILTEDDNLCAIVISYGNTNEEVILLDISAEKVNNLTESLKNEKKETYRWETVRWIGDSHLLVATDFKNDINRLGILSTNGNFNELNNLEQKYEFNVATYRKGSNKTYFSVNKEGFDELFCCEFTTKEVKNLEKIDLPAKGVIFYGDTRSFSRAISLSYDCKFLAISFSSSTIPSSPWLIDLETKKVWPAIDVKTAGIPLISFVECKLERFSSFDQLSVPYFIYYPTKEKPKSGFPVLILVHGGPESQIRPYFNPVIQFFVAAGYVVATPNIRGSSGYGRKYMDLDNVEKRLDSIKDIAFLAKELKKNEKIDPSKLVVYGASYGGFAVLSSLTEYPDIWAAGVDIVGISNFVTFLQNTASWRRKLREAEYGSLEKDLEVLKSISPINKIDRIQAPLFIIHGDNDERVPLSETLQMYEKMKQKGLNVALLRFSDEGHGITKLPNKIKAYTKILEWLNTLLKN